MPGTTKKNEVSVNTSHLGHLEVLVDDRLFASIVPHRKGFARTIFEKGEVLIRCGVSPTYEHAVGALIEEAKAFGVRIPLETAPEPMDMMRTAFHDAAGAFSRISNMVELHLTTHCRDARLRAELKATMQKFHAAQDMAAKAFREHQRRR